MILYNGCNLLSAKRSYDRWYSFLYKDRENEYQEKSHDLMYRNEINSIKCVGNTVRVSFLKDDMYISFPNTMTENLDNFIIKNESFFNFKKMLARTIKFINGLDTIHHGIVKSFIDSCKYNELVNINLMIRPRLSKNDRKQLKYIRHLYYDIGTTKVLLGWNFGSDDMKIVDISSINYVIVGPKILNLGTREITDPKFEKVVRVNKKHNLHESTHINSCFGEFLFEKDGFYEAVELKEICGNIQYENKFKEEFTNNFVLNLYSSMMDDIEMAINKREYMIVVKRIIENLSNHKIEN